MHYKVRPISLEEARAFIAKHHRHSDAPLSWKYGASIRDENGRILGVVAVGRPTSRHLDDGETVEVTRVCVIEEKNLCSQLYALARRVAFELGYSRIITYTLMTESGVSLKAAGWKQAAVTKPGSWSYGKRSRKHKDISSRVKIRWESSK